ncbi:MAG: helix-turn-helix transcriptional regulator [Burkholderiaceae bacterium]|nr:helix-turn-helix transcriptional regulator [Burkholderiaceae bacterium]
MEVWNVATRCDLNDGQLPISATAHLLGALTAADLAASLRAFLDALAPFEFLTYVRYVQGRNRGPAPPELVAGLSAPDLLNVTAQCFAIYRQRFWRHDECTSIAQRLAHDDGFIAIVRFTPGDLDAPRWRRDVYRRMHIDDRLSILYAPAPGAVFGLNAYRGRRRGVFGRNEIDRVVAAAPLVREIHRLRLSGFTGRSAYVDRLERVTRRLRERFPDLSTRETDVCARIACGVTAQGIAAELELSTSTVTTLRKRAYEKLRRRRTAPGRAQLAELAC